MEIDEYLKGILGQILDSDKILINLSDNPDELLVIKKEISKIKGLLLVIYNKLNSKKYQSDHFVTLRKLSMHYIDTYDFTREIENLAPVYFNDSNRLKNLRLLIFLESAKFTWWRSKKETFEVGRKNIPVWGRDRRC